VANTPPGGIVTTVKLPSLISLGHFLQNALQVEGSLARETIGYNREMRVTAPPVLRPASPT